MHTTRLFPSGLLNRTANFKIFRKHFVSVLMMTCNSVAKMNNALFLSRTEEVICLSTHIVVDVFRWGDSVIENVVVVSMVDHEESSGFEQKNSIIGRKGNTEWV